MLCQEHLARATSREESLWPGPHAQEASSQGGGAAPVLPAQCRRASGQWFQDAGSPYALLRRLLLPRGPVQRLPISRAVCWLTSCPIVLLDVDSLLQCSRSSGRVAPLGTHPFGADEAGSSSDDAPSCCTSCSTHSNMRSASPRPFFSFSTCSFVESASSRTAAT